MEVIMKNIIEREVDGILTDILDDYKKERAIDKNDICQQFDIPFWIWSSSIYRTNHQTLWKQIQDGSTRPGMTDALAQLLLHIAGIHTPWYFPKYDILNGMYNVNRKRSIRNERHYVTIALYRYHA